MINFDEVTEENLKEHPNWLQLPDRPYILLIIRGSGYGKTYPLFHLISHQRVY